ncbi:MAG TPA: hypothetical protein VGN64_01560 [Dyadobacter sp.]|jgi:hypothetical protein|nr:hypothetical protein [Dyadobacter sp.]
MATQSFSNLQLELLKVYSREVEEEDLLAIRKILADYFANKAIEMADKVWDKNKWSAEDTLELSKEHNRKSIPS